MEEEIVVYFVGYEDDIKKAVDNKVYIDFGQAAQAHRYATKIVGLDGMQLFQAVITLIEVVVTDDYKLLKSL